jgi:uncharacterized membrane protein YesL
MFEMDRKNKIEFINKGIDRYKQDDASISILFCLFNITRYIIYLHFLKNIQQQRNLKNERRLLLLFFFYLLIVIFLFIVLKYYN